LILVEGLLLLFFTLPKERNIPTFIQRLDIMLLKTKSLELLPLALEALLLKYSFFVFSLLD